MANHLTAPFVRIRSVFLAAAFASLAACGGGGDGGAAPSPVSYTGKTTPAEITNSNAASLTLSAYSAGNTGSGASPFAIQSQAQSQIGIADVLTVARKVKDVAQMAKSSPTASATGALVELGSLPGECGGNLVFTYDDVTFVDTVIFNDYCLASGTTWAGEVTMTAGGSADAEFVLNLLIRDNASGLVYRLENYTIAMTYVYDSGSPPTLLGTRISFQGTFYSPSEGYVEVTTSTTKPFYYLVNVTYPQEGVLVIKEADLTSPATSTLTVTTPGQYKIEADLDGNGSIDMTTTGSW